MINSNNDSARYKKLCVIPANWQTLRNEELNNTQLFVQFIYIDTQKKEHTLTIFPLDGLDIEFKKKEILNIIQILPLKLKSGFNPLYEDYYDYKGLFIDYALKITPASIGLNNGSITIKLNYVNPSEFLFCLNETYSNKPSFEILENGKYLLQIIHIITNQILRVQIEILPVEPNSFCPHHNVLDAFRNAFPFANGSEDYKREFGLSMERIYLMIIKLNLHHKKIIDLKKSDIKALLDGLNIPPHVYNKTRGYLSSIYNVLLDFEVLDQNIIKTVPKHKTIKKVREIIPDDELDAILAFLKSEHYTFYRYVKIFYHSGSRTTELFSLKAKDVNLKRREFKITMNKGHSPSEEIKAILPDVYDLWQEIINECDDYNQYLFSKNYLPGKHKLNARINAAYWSYHVQKKLNISYTFYMLKHKFLDILDQYQNMIVFSNNNIASIHAGHKTTKMTDRHYLMGKKNRQLEALKLFSLDNIKIDNTK